MAGERPVGVTIVAVIAWIIGAIQIVGAILALIAGAGFDAWVVLIIGILTIAVSLGLFRGSNIARIIMAIVFTLNLIVAVWAIVIGVDFWDQVIAGALAIVGLVFLFSKKASAFFQ
jgi:glucose dehydrogenase